MSSKKSIHGMTAHAEAFADYVIEHGRHPGKILALLVVVFGAGASGVLMLPMDNAKLQLGIALGGCGLAVFALLGLILVRSRRKRLKEHAHPADVDQGEAAVAEPRWSTGRTWLVAVVAVALLSSVAWVASQSWPDRGASHGDPEEEDPCGAMLSAWDLPPDLCARQEGLKALGLSGDVDRVDWLVSGLVELDLAGSRVRDLSGVPETVHTLDISNTPISSLRGLPASVTDLQISETEVTSLEGLSPYLEEVELERVALTEDEAFPESVGSLRIDVAAFRALARRPASLSRLTLSAATGELALELLEDLEDLRELEVRGQGFRLPAEGLPGQLQSLQLVGGSLTEWSDLPSCLRELVVAVDTGFVDLSGLPASIERLGIDGVDTIRLDGAPPALSHLEADSVALEALGNLPEHLPSLETVWPTERQLDELPHYLKSLEIFGSRTLRLGPLPSFLKSLTLNAQEHSGFDVALPDSLERLSYRYCNEIPVEALPKGLRELDLAGCAIDDLRALGAEGVALQGLEVLDLSGTDVRSLDGVPGSVRELDISGSRISDLGGLPPNLEELTLHHGQVETLEGLPSTVKALYFIEPMSTSVPPRSRN